MCLALFAVAFGTNVPTPLLLVYQQQLHLSDAALTAVFGAYAVGLVPALLVAGPVSDRVGRRRLTVPFVALALVSTALFLPATDVEWLLFVARLAQGLVVGVVFSVATTWLVELTGEREHETAGRRATVAMTLGFSLGPLVSGVLAQWAPHPTVLPYLVHLALVLVGLAALVGVPETLVVPASGPLLRVRLRPGAARPFWLLAVPTAVCVFALPTVVLTLVPLYLPAHADPIFFTGVLGAVALGSGTLAALTVGRRVALPGPLGVVAGAAGYAVCAVSVLTGSAVPALAAAVLLGVGNGLTLSAGLSLTQRLADPLARGTMTSVFYAFAYLGFAAPYLLAVVAQGIGVGPALAVATVLVAALAATLAGAWRTVLAGVR